MPGLVGEISAAREKPQARSLKGDDGGGGGAGLAAPAPAQQSMREETKVTVPQDMDTLTMCRGRGPSGTSQRSRSSIYTGRRHQAPRGDRFRGPGDAGYHELFREVLGITSYGHRLLLLAELEELIGPVKWRRR